MDYKTLFDKASKEYVDKGAGRYMPNDVPTYMGIYLLMFGEVPHIISLENDGLYRNAEADTERYEDEGEYTEEVDVNIFKFDRVLKSRTMDSFAKHFEKLGGYIVRHDKFPVIVYDHLLIFIDDETYGTIVMTNKPVLEQYLIDLVVDEKNQDDKYCFCHYVTHNSNGFSQTSLKIGTWEDNVDLETNYNDDLPDKQIKDFLKSKQSGLVLLHGTPGTGKTHYIRHLMKNIKGRSFMLLDPNTFAYITDSSFIDLLLDAKNSVIILEDCENMLIDRAAGNSELTALLNLSDGILGDSFNFKFICTFNANISKLDKAVLRKGRLKVKYEFKSLSVEKTKRLADKLGKEIPENKEMTLAEIYNIEEDNGVKAEKQIGFRK